jgi:ABC-type phosphate transport system substrate-binding protein
MVYNNTLAQVCIIANKSINVKTIDINKLTNLYNIQSNEIGSQKVKLFYLNSDNETEKLFLETLGKTFIELKKIWLKVKLTGSGTPPETVNSDEEMIQKVTSTPDAIGFVDLKSIKANVKIIAKLSE